jgi:hypothetical protein
LIKPAINSQPSSALSLDSVASPETQYPWSQKSIQNDTPFPRYGHAANHVAARDGEIFVMGGLKGSDVFGDLWIIETGIHFFPPKIVNICLDSVQSPCNSI